MNRAPQFNPESPPTPAAQDASVDVLALLKEQAALFAKLESVAAKQRGLITAGASAPLLALLAERQKLTLELTTLAGHLRPVRAAWDSYRAALNPDQQQEAADLWKEAERRLNGLASSDEQDARLLSAKKEGARRQIGATVACREAVSAYASPASTGVRIDRVHEES